ncbi:MAG: S-methyl-5-thioribose-1-phosphate isomerase [Actinomycetota bacterium]
MSARIRHRFTGRFALVGLSIGVVTGLGGQLSLGQFAVAGIGAAASFRVTSATGNYTLGLAAAGLAAARLAGRLYGDRVTGMLPPVMRAIEWRSGDIVVIDQTLLPHRLVRRTLRTTEEVAEAISTLRVRGAPLLGIVGAMGVAQAALRPRASRSATVLARAEQAGALLAATRPTAVNLSWAIERTLAVARAEATSLGPAALARRLLQEALAIHAEDERACEVMAAHALEFFSAGATVLTHCNTGFLVTGGRGTALGAIGYAHEQGLAVRVFACETRPLLQGARLTAWELGRLGIEHALIVDGAAAGLIARGEVSLVMTGADRIAANGDVANKVGTYAHALAARAAGIPFVIVAPTTTVDLKTRSGSGIEVEERAASEVLSFGGAAIAPKGTAARNPAFDVTPADLVTAIVTEQGVARAPYRRSLAAQVRRAVRA